MAADQNKNTKLSDVYLSPDKNQPNGSFNLHNHSKEDLLRLLSILQGELEAQDIYITNLIFQLRHTKELKSRYFIDNPFAALLRDEVALGNHAPKKSLNHKINVDPLQLLEHIFQEFKKQQRRMKQQISMSTKVQKIMSTELAKEKQNRFMRSESEQLIIQNEKYAANISCEKLKLKKLKAEYKNLLNLCNTERTNYRMIITMLLHDKELLAKELRKFVNVEKTETNDNEIKTKDTNDVASMSSDLEDLVRKNQDERDKLVDENLLLKNRITRLELALKMHKLQLAAKTQHNTKSVIENQTVETPFLPTTGCTTQLTARISSPGDPGQNFSNHSHSWDKNRIRHDSVRVVQSSKDVTLVPSSSHPPMMLAGGVGEVTASGYYSVKGSTNITTVNTSKESTNMKVDNSNTIDNSGNITTSKPLSKPIISKPKSLTLTAPSIPPKRNLYLTKANLDQQPLSSPITSGATNFAMNSPNLPNPPINSPFAVNRDKAPNISRITSAQFQAVRDKFQNHSSQDTDSKKKTSMASIATTSITEQGASPLPKSEKHMLPDVSQRGTPIKTEPVYPIHSKPSGPKPVPPPKQKSLVNSEIRPPPLPPKRPVTSTGDGNGTQIKSEINRRRAASAKVAASTNNTAMQSNKARRTVSLKRSTNNTAATNSNNNGDLRNNFPTPPASRINDQAKFGQK